MTVDTVFQDMKYYLSKFAMGLEGIILPVLLFFAPVKGILITVAAFIVLDTISGIWKSRVNKVPITSRALSSVISKLLLYELAIITTYLLDYYVIGDILHNIFGIEGLLVKVTALLLVFIEAQSINENYKIAKGIDLWKEFKKLLTRVKEVTTEVSGIQKDMDGMSIDKTNKPEKKPSQDLGDVFED